VLISEFGLAKGLADTSKTTIKVEDTNNRQGKVKLVDKEVHKVQILDPATGTGTFLAETIKYLHEKKQYFKWSNYVEKDLIPRLHGFEIVMASYAMAHLKLDILLKLTGYTPQAQQRLKVYLTNSLEEHHEATDTLFASFLATESQEADKVKRDTPVMVVMGNPPYAVSSSNKSDWIQNLISDYKKNLNERNIQPLSDDYIKFIRYGQHYIDKNGEGILAYISNNSFIDGIIHRQMRKSLLESFDKIYILDLHGNSKKKETTPEGGVDQNVFDIMQGVSINIFIKKKSKSKQLAEVYHYDLYGKRDIKYEFLDNNSVKSIEWEKLKYKEPEYFFVKKDFKNTKVYGNYLPITDLFNKNSVGVVTSLDKVVLANDKRTLEKQIIDYGEVFEDKYIKEYLYRPFDIKYIYYKPKILGRSREKIMKSFFKNNIGLIVSKQFGGHKHFISFSTKYINDKSSQPFAPYYNNPLYIYPDDNSLDSQREPNLNKEIVAEIEKALNLKFVNEKIEDCKDTFAPIDILDYIYAVLHSPQYREKYKEFLKIDFPRVPYPDISSFWQLVAKGSELRSYHQLENPKLYDIVISLNDSDNNTIERKIVKKDVEIADNSVKLWINDEQYIDNIPLVAWEFYIGGYQPAQKWLKDRVGRELNEEDFEHYNKIIGALINTDRIMKEIDTIIKI
jgi:predicted helicase